MDDVTFTLNGLSLDLDDGTGDKLKVVDMDGWWDGPGSTGEATQNAYANGAWIDPAFDTAVRLGAVGTAKALERPRLRNLLQRLLAAIPRNTLAPLVGVEDGLVRHMMVRLDQVNPNVDWQGHRLAEWDFQLVAPDGRKFSGDGLSGLSYSGAVGLPTVTGGLQVPATMGTITNLVTNPSFEVNTTGWTGTGATLVRSTGFPQMVQRGTAILQATSDGTNVAPSASTSGLAITAGQWMGAKAFIASEFAGNVQVRLNISFRDAGNAEVGSAATTYVKAAFYTGTVAQLTAQAPANTVSAVLSLQFRNGDAPGSNLASGQRLWADIVQAHAAVSQADAQAMLDHGYVDGAQTTAGVGTYAWTGTAHASTSTFTGSSWGGLIAPFQIAATVVNNTVTIANAGNATPPVQITLLGPVTNPVISTVDGQRMEFNITLDAAQTLVIDLDAKTILLNGQYNRRNTLRGDWIVPKGGTVFIFNAASYNSTATMTVRWSDAWTN